MTTTTPAMRDVHQPLLRCRKGERVRQRRPMPVSLPLRRRSTAAAVAPVARDPDDVLELGLTANSHRSRSGFLRRAGLRAARLTRIAVVTRVLSGGRCVMTRLRHALEELQEPRGRAVSLGSLAGRVERQRAVRRRLVLVTRAHGVAGRADSPGAPASAGRPPGRPRVARCRREHRAAHRQGA